MVAIDVSLIICQQLDNPTLCESKYREIRGDDVLHVILVTADSLDDGMFVLLKKSEDAEADYSITNKRPNRRSRKGRKLSVVSKTNSSDC